MCQRHFFPNLDQWISDVLPQHQEIADQNAFEKNWCQRGYPGALDQVPKGQASLVATSPGAAGEIPQRENGQWQIQGPELPDRLQQGWLFGVAPKQQGVLPKVHSHAGVL